MPEKLKTEVYNIVQEVVIKIISKEKKCKRQNGCLRRSYKWLSEEEKRKAKEERKDIHLNAEFQRIERRDKKAFLRSMQRNRGKKQKGKEQRSLQEN